MPKTTEQLIAIAAHCHSDLNIFGAIVALLEGGTLYTISGQTAAESLITMCKAEMRKQLRAYETVLARAEK